MRYVYTIIVCVCFLGSSHLSAFAQNVNFPDANLAAVVRTKLDLAVGADIPQTSLATITSLSANNRGITNLTGLEHATGLTLLQLTGNPISDFTPIGSLTSLRTLSLIETGFSNSDISILSPLVNLRVLYLNDNRISNLQALVNVISANMFYLSDLDIGDNRFCDITPLTALKGQLTVLSFNYIQISDFGPLAEFSNLTGLHLKRTGISNLELLRGLTNLTSIDISSNGISNIEPLSGLTNLTTLFMDRNQVSDLTPISDLTKLTLVWACWNPFPTDPNPFESLGGLTAMEDFSVDTTYETQAKAVFPTAAQFFCNPANASLGALQSFCPTLSETALKPGPERELKVNRRRIIITQCGLGWAPQSQYGGELPKVMIYALEFEYDPESHGRYICKTIEIRTGDDSIENLAGWNLYLGTLYNPSRIPMTIPEEHSQITGRILRLTPEMLGLETFPCNTVNGISHPLPGVQYVLKTDENILIDTTYSCFVWGQNAYTTVNGKNVKSKRRISSAVLRQMETPRLERYILDNIGVYITYMNIEAFTWDRAVLSDWLLASSEETEITGGNAPSYHKKLTTSWAALKKPEIP